MNTKILQAIIWLCLCVTIRAADGGDARFIRSAGTYQIAPHMTLVISPDASHYSFDRLYSGEQSSNRAAHEAALTQPFLFYWDDATQTLWEATTKEITAHTPKGITVYDNTAKTLKRTPVPFRQEVQQTFKSR